MYYTGMAHVCLKEFKKETGPKKPDHSTKQLRQSLGHFTVATVAGNVLPIKSMAGCME